MIFAKQQGFPPMEKIYQPMFLYPMMVQQFVTYGLVLIHDKADNAAQVVGVKTMLQEAVDDEGAPFYRFAGVSSPHRVLVHHVVPSGVTVANIGLLRGSSTRYAASAGAGKMFNRGWARALDFGADILIVVDNYLNLVGQTINASLHGLYGGFGMSEKNWGIAVNKNCYSWIGLVSDSNTYAQTVQEIKDDLTTGGYGWH